MNSKLLSEAHDRAAQKHGYADWYQIDCLEIETYEKDAIKTTLISDVSIEYEKLLRIGKTNKQRRDYFAGCALQALIAKIPLLDQQGEFGKTISENDVQEIKKQIAESAWAYADFMLYTETFNS